MLHTCGVSYWLANHPREFQQLRWAAGMGDEAQPATSILVQTLCTKVLRVARWRSRIRRAAAKVTHPTGAASSRLGVPSKGFFFLIFVSICMVMFIPVVVFSFFLRIETGHEVLDEMIGRCCGELSIIIYGDALHGGASRQ